MKKRNKIILFLILLICLLLTLYSCTYKNNKVDENKKINSISKNEKNNIQKNNNNKTNEKVVDKKEEKSNNKINYFSEKVSKYENLNKENFSNNSYNEFKKVLNDTKEKVIKNKDKINKQELDNYVEKIEEASKKLTIDKSKLIAKIEEAKSKNEADYSAESFAKLSSAISDAENVKNNDNSTQKDIDNALNNLQEVINNLSVDKSLLNSEIEKYNSLDESLYSTDSYNEFKKVLDTAKSVSENSSIQSEVNETLEYLKEAAKKLTTDKSKLIAKIEEAKSKTETDYSSESFAKLSSAISDAENVKNNDNSTQKDIDNALNNLQEAINNLSVDKSELQYQINKGEDIVNNSSLYTEDFYNEFLSVFNNSKNLFENKNAKQSEINSEIEKLKNAISNLKKKPKNKPTLSITELIEKVKEKSITINYNLTDTDNTLIEAKTKLYKEDNEIKETVISNNEASFSKLELNTPYTIKTELKYNINGTEETEILEDIRNFTLKDEVKKVELKNINSISLMKKEGNSFVTISNLSSISSDLENYFVKIKSNTMTESLFKVSKIEDDGDKYKVTIHAPLLVQYNNNSKEYDDDYTIIVNKNSSNDNVNTDLMSATVVNYSQLKNYNQDRQQLYENIEKLMPLYNRDYIVSIANKLNKPNNLFDKKVVAVVPMNNNKIITDINKDKTNINKLMIHYSDNTIEYLNINYKEDYKNIIPEYTINDTELIYTPNQYINDYTNIINNVRNEFLNVEYFSDEVFNKLNYIQPNPSKPESRDNVLEKLYLKNSFNNVKTNIDTILNSLLSNSVVLGNSSNANAEYIENYLKENKVNILLGLSYLNKWYDINFDEINIKDIVMFKQDFFGKNVNELEWIANIGKLGFNSLNPVNNFSSYNILLVNNTGQNNLFEYLEKNKTLFLPNKDMNTWFKESSKAYIVEIPSDELPNANVKIYETLKEQKYNNMILPLLTVSENSVYIIRDLSTISFGIFDRYINMSLKDTNPQEFEQKVLELKQRINEVALAHKQYFDLWYKLAPANTRDKLINSLPVWDSLYRFNPKNDYWYEKDFWYSAFGDVPTAISEFFGPVGKWHNHFRDSREAYANGKEVWFVTEGVLNGYAGNAIFAHEMTHNYDGGIYFGGYGRRDSMGLEAFAKGMFEAPRGEGDSFFALNMINNFKNKNNSIHNTSAERFKNDSDLQQYWSRTMDVLYTLDYTEAQVLLTKTNEEKALILKQMRANNNYVDYSSNLTKEELDNMNLQNINDFVDNHLILRGNYGNKYPNRNGYNTSSTIDSLYGILENPNGSPGGHTFKRTAFDLLAAKGYENGMLPYISNKFKKDTQTEGVPYGDSYILRKIFNGAYATFNDFKKAEFKKRIDNKQNLKQITINFKNKQHIIDSYDKLESLIKESLEADIRAIKNNRPNREKRNVSTLRTEIHKAYFNLTNEFRVSIYNN